MEGLSSVSTQSSVRLVLVTNQFNQCSWSAVALTRGIDLEDASITALALQLTTLAVLGSDTIEKLLRDLTIRAATLHTALAAVFLGSLAREVSENATLVSQLLDVVGSFVSFLGISDDLVDERR